MSPSTPEAHSDESGAQPVHPEGWEAELLRRARAVLQRKGMPETPENLEIATRAIGLLMQAEAVHRNEQENQGQRDSRPPI